jgi:hypothetical protein
VATAGEVLNCEVASLEPDVGAGLAPTAGAADAGDATGITGVAGRDADDVPPPLVAVAVKVYAVPFVRPVMTQLPEVPAMVQVLPPGLEVTVNEVGAPPDPVPWATVTAACALPATAVGTAGALGTGGCGVTGLDAPDAPEVPPPFVAVARNV